MSSLKDPKNESFPPEGNDSGEPCQSETPIAGVPEDRDASDEGKDDVQPSPESPSEDSDNDYHVLLSARMLELLSISSEKVLKETSVDGVVQYMKEHPDLKIITMVGAGISTAAGIPDFRSPGTGIYDNLKKYNLPYTNAIFELEYFLSDPEPFYSLANEIFPGSYKPTKAHYFIKLLEDKNLLLRHFSQNIDNLDRMSGISEDKLIEAHGSFYTSHCTNSNCKLKYDLDWLQGKVSQKIIPKCTSCGHIVKPDIIFFGEPLPKKFFQHLSDFQKCDLLIIMGSSLAVEPFASLVCSVKRNVPRLMINATEVGARLGLQFHVPANGRDVLWIEECDKGCELLAEKMGWMLLEQSPESSRWSKMGEANIVWLEHWGCQELKFGELFKEEFNNLLEKRN